MFYARYAKYFLIFIILPVIAFSSCIKDLTTDTSRRVGNVIQVDKVNALLFKDLETEPTPITLDNSNIIQYWVNDHTNLIHGVDKDLNRYKYDSKTEQWISLYEGDSGKNQKYTPSSIAYIKEGMLFESNDSLFYLKNDLINEIEEDFISWRTFPKIGRAHV